MTEPLRPVLVRQALNLTRNTEDAHDLVQDTYLRAYQFFDTFHPGNCIEAWLRRIQKNIFINQYRRKRLHQEWMPLDQSISVEERDLPGEGRLHEISPRDALLLEEVDEDIEAALNLVPEPYREAFLLATFRDYSYEELAERLLCPIGTVRSRLSRARDFLKERLTRPASRYGYATAN